MPKRKARCVITDAELNAIRDRSNDELWAGSCADPVEFAEARADARMLLAEVERLQDRLRAASGGCRMLSEGDKCDCGLCKRDRELERLQAELSWIYTHCELRDGDNTHVDSDDVQSAVAAKAAVESEGGDD